jgi:Na+-translocating ferredoxin:NAD+ oxidoreductase subunit B
MDDNPPGLSRRSFLSGLVRHTALGGLVVGTGYLALKPSRALAQCPPGGDCTSCGSWGSCLLTRARTNWVWQIDPWKCIQCGKCATNCVLNPSASKCVHAFGLCGYCELCTGFFEAQPNALNTGAENQLCPTGAIKRRFVEDPYYEYTIDAELCVGCGKCVKGCSTFGNGSLMLQIDQSRCVRCNRCSIATACPAQAISRVPASQAYLIKTRTRNG